MTYGTTLLTATYTLGGISKTGTTTLTVKCGILINELTTQGPGPTNASSDEWVELYNVTGATIDLSSYVMTYQSTGTPQDTVIATSTTFTANKTLASGGYQLYAHVNYSQNTGSTAATATFGQSGTSVFSSSGSGGGSIRIVDRGGAVCDALGYGTYNGTYKEGTSFATIPTGTQSMGRSSTSADNNANSTDFAIKNARTPKAAN